MKKLIFSDFDGVLFNSVKEAYILSRYAYNDIHFKESIDRIEFNRFHKFRYLITHSYHFYYIFSLIKSNVPDDIFEIEYKKLIDKNQNKKAFEFDKKYIFGREILLKEDYTFWDNLDIPYSFFDDLKELSKENEVVVLTNKKRLPVENKLKKYRADNFKLFANEDLINYSSKAEFIIEYMNKNNFKQSFLIEDSIDNLNQCKKYPNIIPLLVNWGYVSPKEKGLNKNH